MIDDMANSIRWHAKIGQAIAAGTAIWQLASLLLGLAALVLIMAKGHMDGPHLLILALHLMLLLLGLWLGLRLRIDASLFGALFENPDLPAFDLAMRELELMPQDKTNRPIAMRVAGLLRLSRLLAIVVVAQITLLIVTGALAWQ